MNTAEWILVVILSVTLLVFLILGIILLVKLIHITGEAKKIVLTGQDIAENVKDMTSVGGLVKTFTNKINKEMKNGKESK